MEINKFTLENLKKDKKVLGNGWANTYKGFFSDKQHILDFVESAIKLAPKRNKIKVLQVASASGVLGEMLVDKLQKKGIETELTLIDVSKKHLKENNNSKTRKFCADLLTIRLEEIFDVIIMRSSLDYFPTEEMQIQVLQRIANWLAKEGVFVNQVAALANKEERDLTDTIYGLTGKMGKKHFQCEEELQELYAKAGMRIEKISSGAELVLSEKEHAQRYEINLEDIKEIQEIIKKVKFENMRITKTGYEIKFVFPIYAAWKN